MKFLHNLLKKFDYLILVSIVLTLISVIPLLLFLPVLSDHLLFIWSAIITAFAAMFLISLFGYFLTKLIIFMVKQYPRDEE